MFFPFKGLQFARQLGPSVGEYVAAQDRERPRPHADRQLGRGVEPEVHHRPRQPLRRRRDQRRSGDAGAAASGPRSHHDRRPRRAGDAEVQRRARTMHQNQWLAALEELKSDGLENIPVPAPSRSPFRTTTTPTHCSTSARARSRPPAAGRSSERVSARSLPCRRSSGAAPRLWRGWRPRPGAGRDLWELRPHLEQLNETQARLPTHTGLQPSKNLTNA